MIIGRSTNWSHQKHSLECFEKLWWIRRVRSLRGAWERSNTHHGELCLSSKSRTHRTTTREEPCIVEFIRISEREKRGAKNRKKNTGLNYVANITETSERECVFMWVVVEAKHKTANIGNFNRNYQTQVTRFQLESLLHELFWCWLNGFCSARWCGLGHVLSPCVCVSVCTFPPLHHNETLNQNIKLLITSKNDLITWFTNGTSEKWRFGGE